ncbi:MAG: LLM class F420-dependent oxidoreductase, partial [Janthinobacterium lividum]
MSRRLRVGLALTYRGRPGEAADVVADFSHAGAQLVCVSEVWGFDAVSLLGYLAARAPGVELASNTLPLYTRTPALLAMTAAGLDALTGSRFTLGLGASGPQVVEGFHGVAHDAPVARTREVVEICRSVWRGDAVEHQGRHYSVPLAQERGGSGLGTPLRLLNRPPRTRVPVMLAALGPRNTALAAEVAEEWAPFMFRPESAVEVWGDALASGLALRDPALGRLGITVPARVAVGGDVQTGLAEHRSILALYLGGMVVRTRNFYADLARRYGFAAEVDAVQEHFL